MLLYGPPGCGKTLIARQIGKALNAREPKLVVRVPCMPLLGIIDSYLFSFSHSLF